MLYPYARIYPLKIQSKTNFTDQHFETKHPAKLEEVGQFPEEEC